MGLLEGFALVEKRSAQAPKRRAHPSRAFLDAGRGTAPLRALERRRHTGVVIESSDVRGDEIRAVEDALYSGVAGTGIETFAFQ
jgi:hypothetical protein